MLELDVLRDCLIYCAAKKGIELAYHARITDGMFNWNAEALNETLAFIDFVRITHTIPGDERIAFRENTAVWERTESGWKCSHCGKKVAKAGVYTMMTNHAYCGKCGALMKGCDVGE